MICGLWYCSLRYFEHFWTTKQSTFSSVWKEDSDILLYCSQEFFTWPKPTISYPWSSTCAWLLNPSATRTLGNSRWTCCWWPCSCSTTAQCSVLTELFRSKSFFLRRERCYEVIVSGFLGADFQTTWSIRGVTVFHWFRWKWGFVPMLAFFTGTSLG